MAPLVQIMRTTAAHVGELSATMRQADAREVWAAGRHTPEQAVKLSVLASRKAMSGLVDGKVACIFGIASPTLLSDVGQPWLLGSDLVEQHAKRFLRLSRGWFEQQKGQYFALANLVDARNDKAIRWLKWLGFSLDEPVLFGPDQLPFRPFHWRRSDV